MELKSFMQNYNSSVFINFEKLGANKLNSKGTSAASDFANAMNIYIQAIICTETSAVVVYTKWLNMTTRNAFGEVSFFICRRRLKNYLIARNYEPHADVIFIGE
jgi:hypothetical protein